MHQEYGAPCASCAPSTVGAIRPEFTECTECRVHLALCAPSVPSTTGAIRMEVPGTTCTEHRCIEYHGHRVPSEPSTVCIDHCVHQALRAPSAECTEHHWRYCSACTEYRVHRGTEVLRAACAPRYRSTGGS
ncbi:UNVERIFIED_CONTAM: hypothetical protein FKN15_061450 [Acipenser sinensis]